MITWTQFEQQQPALAAVGRRQFYQHGLGLDVHEAPRLSTESPDTLVAGNVVTVEPGVYLPGKFGIRIEDDVVVTQDGIENLTGFRKDLIEVG